MLTRRHCLAAAPAIPALSAFGGLSFLSLLPDEASASTATFDRLLAAHVRVSPDGLNRVTYAAWKANAADMAALDSVIRDMQAVNPASLARPAQFAFWANLYNAVTLQVVLARFPVRSIRDIKPNPLALGPWKEPRVTVAGKRLSLDDIEHTILRKQWRDPRVHYSVNCASIGCPNLMPRAWRAETLEADLDAAARAFIASPRALSLDSQGRATVSSIYHWFKADFGGSDAGVLAHLRQYAPAATAARLATARIAGHRYDWSINSATSAR